MTSAFKGMYGWTSKTLAFEGEDKSRKPAVEEENKKLSDEDLALVEEISKLQVSGSDGSEAIQSLQKRLLATHNKNEKLSQEKEELQKQNTQLKIQFQTLERRLKKTNEDHKQVVIEIHAEYEKNWLPYIRNLERDLQQLRARNNTLLRENQAGFNQVMKLRTEHAEMKRSSNIAEQSVKKYEQQVNKLTETISRASQREDARPGTTRDDDYFATEFSELANAIQQWVFRHFRGGPEDRLQNLDPLLKTSFDEAVHPDEPVKKSRAQLDAISAMVAHQLTTNVFPQFRFLGIGDLHDPFLTLYNSIEGTDLQRQMWRSKTMDMVFKHQDVMKAFDETVKTLSDSLEELFGGLAVKSSKADLRNKALYSLVEKTAKLAIEVAQQQAVFDLYPISPGEDFESIIMEDSAADAEEEDQEENGAVVRIQLFPAVLRTDFDRAGKLKNENCAVVLKAKVVAKVE